MKIILIGNYPPDKQESMKRYADMLAEGFINRNIEVEMWLPTVFLGGFFKSTLYGIGKWFGYMDKWILTSILFRWKILMKGNIINQYKIHVCDHSNAPYLAHLPSSIASITCHDVLAIRGALGFEDAHVSTSSTGKFYQKWILNNLKKASKIACVSKLTLNQLIELVPEKSHKSGYWTVIHNAFNNDFKVLSTDDRDRLLKKAGIEKDTKYIFIVGSNLERKNRKLLIQMIAQLSNQWKGVVCFAGQPIPESLKKIAHDLNVSDKIISVVKPDHDTLVALYNGCEAFVFPSLSEGFGWPIIEAQACGVPVITSTIEPMPEVSGGGALLADPYNPADFVSKFLQLANQDLRKDLILAGFENCKRFQPEIMIDHFIDFFEYNNTHN